jgi:hypothetical protein
MNILKILMNTEFTSFAEFDYETFGGAEAGASDNAKIGKYKDMVVVIDGTSKDPSSIEVFEQSGECIYRGYMTKDGLGIRQYDASGHRS